MYCTVALENYDSFSQGQIITTFCKQNLKKIAEKLERQFEVIDILHVCICMYFQYSLF